MKPFLTYNEQLNKLRQKGLTINDETDAKQHLQALGYFNLIGGYKEPLRNPHTHRYIPGVSFDDILALYEFDAALQNLFFRYLRLIELNLRNQISYTFCEHFGPEQTAYLTDSNYQNSPRKRRTVNRLINILQREANDNQDYPYVVHQRNTYHNVPLWVLMGTLTFGNISKMYQVLLPQLQSRICKNFPHVNEHEMEQFLKVLVLYRNVCAHNERLFSHKVHSEIPDTLVHAKLRIPKHGNQYVYGKHDLFCVVIAFKYLLPKEQFSAFKRNLKVIISRYLHNSQALGQNQLLYWMGFPSNWENIGRLKKIH